jgi:hypothetical protein
MPPSLSWRGCHSNVTGGSDRTSLFFTDDGLRARLVLGGYLKKRGGTSHE